MKKRIISILSSATIILTYFGTSYSVSAEENEKEYEALYYIEVDENGDGIYDCIEITDCDKNATVLEIPSEINGLPVKSIGNSAIGSVFSEAFPSYLESISLPESITHIGEDAFRNCAYLENIVIPIGVESIGMYAFSGCINLKDITIPTSVCEVGSFAFLDTPWLEQMKIESPLVIAGSVVVDGRACTGTVNVPEGIISIAPYAFTYYSLKQQEYIAADINEISLPDTVTSIGYNAFAGCKSLESVTIGNNVLLIEQDVFTECTNLSSITIENPSCEISDYSPGHTICNGYDEDYIPYFNGTIYGYWTSTAHNYAWKCNYNFISIDSVPEYLPGDINDDAKINLYDAIEICKCIMSMRTLTSEEELVADFDYNGVVDLYDVIGIARELLPQ